MDALNLMYNLKQYKKESLTAERLLGLTHDISHSLGPVYHDDKLIIQRLSGFKEVKILFPFKHLNNSIVNYLNNIPEVDRWHVINGKLGVFFK